MFHTTMFRNNIAKAALRVGYNRFTQRELSTTGLRPQDAPSNVYSIPGCGIPKWEIDTKHKEVKNTEKVVALPSHLIRPPCSPAHKPGEYQTCVVDGTEGGMYCIPCREKYKFPPFSENIDFEPPKLRECWWKGTSHCREEVDYAPVSNFTQQTPCHLDINL